jgi:hypothetical protein
MQLTQLVHELSRSWQTRMGIGRPAAGSGRGRALPRGVAARPSPDTAGLGPCGLRSLAPTMQTATYVAHSVQATMPGLTTRQGRGPPRGAAPLEGARGQGRLREADTRQGRHAIPRNELELFLEICLDNSVEMKSD